MRRAMIVAFGLALVAVYAVVAMVDAIPLYVVYLPMVFSQPSATPTLTPTPTPTPIPPTFFDEFSNPASG